MRLSVVIVSYNVSPFLEQCLLSVRRAMEGIKGEVWVVDNASTDDSVAMVQHRFPEVRLLVNAENVGFAVANNQAIRCSQGEYVLLLNPDTLVEEGTFERCLHFMDAHPEAGALGVRLIDGSGQYLPESKRGFPTPWVSFCKMVGLGALFPRSVFFNGYYLGHLDPLQTQAVEVLAGCFMFIRRQALEKAGLLDEAFFMYGEDIDLSYRIRQAGFANYYFPHVRVLHYKGESAQKDRFQYVRRFYEAMIIFARKHFRRRGARAVALLLQIAIALRAMAALLSQAAHRVWLPLLDGVVSYTGLVGLKDFWAAYYYKDPDYFQPSILWFNFPLYTAVWLAALWLGGSYDRRWRYDLLRLLRNLGLGSILLAAIYGFLNQAFRPSRALLLMGAAWVAFSLTILRIALYALAYRSLRIGQVRRRRILIVGAADECERASRLLTSAEIAWELTTTLPPEQWTRLPALVRVFKADELIFCTRDVPISHTLDIMQKVGPRVHYKTLPPQSNHIIGSSSKDRPGELYSVAPQYRLDNPEYRRTKRIFDLVACALLLVLPPLWIFLLSQRKLILRNWWRVCLGQKTWIGYAPSIQSKRYPSLPRGVFPLLPPSYNIALTEAEIERLHFLYTKNWNLWRDAELLFQHLFLNKKF